GGMKRRLIVARALINQPELLLLDEPTTGLDPQARHLLWDRLYSLKRQGVTLVLTTHYMDEAEQLCDRLVIMDGGRIVVEGEPRIFRRLWRGSVYSSFITPVLFLAAMGVGLGGLIDERNGAVGGLDYLTFVAPGLLAASAMQTAAGESLWPVMAGTKWVRTFHAMVATPVGASDVYGGFIVWTAVRVAMSASAFVLVAA